MLKESRVGDTNEMCLFPQSSMKSQWKLVVFSQDLLTSLAHEELRAADCHVTSYTYFFAWRGTPKLQMFTGARKGCLGIIYFPDVCLVGLAW